MDKNEKMEPGKLLILNSLHPETEPIANIDVGLHPAHVVINSNSQLAFVTNSEDNNVSLIDLEKKKVMGKIKTGQFPHGLRISPNGSEIYVANVNDNSVWAPIDYSFVMAKKYNIKLICPLTDQYWWANGNYGDICNKRGVSKDQFWYNQDVRNDFKNYINSYFNHSVLLD